MEDFEFEFERRHGEQCKILGGLYWGELADRLAVLLGRDGRSGRGNHDEGK